MYCKTLQPSELLACFDLDHTLLKPITGKFARSKDDAQLVFPQINDKLKKLRDDGYKIVIFTNQKGLKNVNDIFYKVEKFLGAAEIYISTGEDYYRKPSIGMLEDCLEKNGAIKDIFYVGDAAGRAGDFSASDAQFAYNFRIPFYTPEAFFLGYKNEYHVPKITIPIEISLPIKNFNGLNLILIVGPPASGKSFLSSKLAALGNFTIINNDTLGSKSKKYYLDSLGGGNIIVDNTNATRATREFYIDAAKKYNYKVYAIVMNTSKELCNYLNWYRTLTNKSKLIPHVASHTFYKHYQAPHCSERIDFIFNYLPKFKKQIFKYSF